jgi:Bacteriocin-protection, YdeI or OmpD-Associated
VTAYLTFEGRVETVQWGRATYTILRLPPDVEVALTALRAKRVEGEMNDHPVNLALTRAPVVDGVFLWAGQSLLDRAGIIPGEQIEVRLRPVPGDLVDVPEDVTAALRQAGLTTRWDALTPGKRRGMLYQVETAKTSATRLKRIAALVGIIQE